LGSQVLSLTLDEWTAVDYRDMLARGNDVVNAELEASLPAHGPGVRKPCMAVAVAGLERHQVPRGEGGEGGDGGGDGGGGSSGGGCDDMLTLEVFVRAKYVSKSFVIGGDGAVAASGGSCGGGGTASSPAGCRFLGAAVEYTGVLRVTVVRAAGLPSMDAGSPSDPYAAGGGRDGTVTVTASIEWNVQFRV